MTFFEQSVFFDVSVSLVSYGLGVLLTVVDLAGRPERLGGGPAILLVERGPVELTGADVSVTLERGQAVFVPASETAVSVGGTGRVWLAATGDATG